MRQQSLGLPVPALWSSAVDWPLRPSLEDQQTRASYRLCTPSFGQCERGPLGSSRSPTRRPGELAYDSTATKAIIQAHWPVWPRDQWTRASNSVHGLAHAQNEIWTTQWTGTDLLQRCAWPPSDKMTNFRMITGEILIDLRPQIWI